MSTEYTKAFLRQYGVSTKEIQRLQEELAAWRARAQSVTAHWDAAAGGGNGAGFPACVERIAELEAELYAALEHAITLHREIAAAIASVPDARARLLLCLRYIDGLTWERVAENMNYSRSRTFDLHTEALNQLKIALNRTVFM